MINFDFSSLEEARQQFNDWQGSATIFIDFDTMNAWCEVESAADYDSPIFHLVKKGEMHGRNDKYNIVVLKSVLEDKYNDFKEGYEEWQINDDYRYSEIFYINE